MTCWLKLYRLAILGALGWMLTATGISQQPPPPPPPVRMTVQGTASAPEKLTGLFESKEGGFKIAFPAKPIVQSRETESSFGKATMKLYVLPTTFANYTVVHFDFPTAIKDKFDLDTRFDAIRDNQLKRADTRLVSENELYFGSHYGRDIVMADTQATHWIRVLIVEQRLFLIGVQTKGNYATQSPTLKELNEARAKKFFDSFTVTEIPKPAMTAVEIPEDLGVSVNGSTFVSEFLGISFEVPKGWVVLDPDEKDLVLELGKEEVARKQPRLSERMTAANSRVLFGASKSPLGTSVNTALLLVAVEKSPYPNFLALSAAKSSITAFPDKAEKVIKPPTVQVIGGIEFAWLETFDTEKKLTQRMYFANRNGLVLEFALTYSDPADLDPMLRSLESLKAKK